ncbi:MAG: class I tRNA ligase family protein, partial [Myxococcota bacterium]
MTSAKDFIASEERILRFWEESNAFERLQELRAEAPLFRFVDGPITANNPMGVHHAWGRSLKDVLLRYKAMRGFRNRYQNGFDCQGLWVEVEVERALGFNGKADIEAFGLDKFSHACRERVDESAGVITQPSIRLGQWMDWSDSYYTHTDANITGIWHFLKQCHERGWLHEDGLPMPWCPRCGTSLSEHEMAGSYSDVEHLSLFGHVPLREDPTRHLLAWTTTPWTLAANVALAVHPELAYVEVAHADWSHTLVLAKGALANVFGKQRVEVVRTLSGRDLEGLEYETFLPDLPAQAEVAHRVVPWKEVDAEEGSGIVHIAPGCGREDYELGQELGLAAIKPVDDSGIYTAEMGWLADRKAVEVADDVAASLERAGKLLRAEPYQHSFPHCWRCKGELIFRLVDEWFISTEGVRPDLIAAARRVEWKPEFMAARMEDWLQNMGSWCISRKRYWGLPLPFYQCGGCEKLTVVGSLPELRERAVDPAVVDGLPELHRQWIDEVKTACPECGEAAERVPEVGDCWLDAGIVPFSTLGYFEDREAWKQRYPAEWICEMRE